MRTPPTPRAGGLGGILGLAGCSRTPLSLRRVKERYADLDAQRPEIKQDLAGWAEELELSQAENDRIWQTMGRYVWPNPVAYDTYEEEVAHLEDWLDTRMDWMKEALERL